MSHGPGLSTAPHKTAADLITLTPVGGILSGDLRAAPARPAAAVVFARDLLARFNLNDLALGAAAEAALAAHPVGAGAGSFPAGPTQRDGIYLGF